MALFHHILYPVDFSQRCKSVAAAVLAMARQHKATLTLLHTFELPVGGYGDAYAYLPTAINEFNDASQTALDRFALEHFPGELIQKTVQCGAPVESIVEFVDRNGVDLVMMASHGRSRFRSLLLGSVTAGVLHDAHCPVWTDSHSEEIPPVLDGYRNIVCAIDLTPKSAEPLRFAKRMACEVKADLRVVYAEPAIEDYVRSESASRFRRFLEFRAKEEYEPLAQQANLQVPLEVVSGPIGESIAAVVKRFKGDLLVIGRGVIEERLGRLRTNAYDIIRNSPCPVLSV
jgi:nucleotide-binding universal stress UspA family protein